MYMSYHDIHEEQKKSLNYKLSVAIEQITKAFQLSTHKQAIAFSGGKDSTVLWHIIRTHFPDSSPYITFCNTGVEFPESLKFTRQLGYAWGGDRFKETSLRRTTKETLKYQAQKETLQYIEQNPQLLKHILRIDGRLKTVDVLEECATPEMWEDFRNRKLTWRKGTIMSYWWCCDQYGYPILAKKLTKLSSKRISLDVYLKYADCASDDPEFIQYTELLKSVKFSNHCCTVLKKEPAELLQAELDVDLVFKGLMASEGQQRLMSFSKYGYINSTKRPHVNPFYSCNPIAIWTEKDIWDYIALHNVPISPLYSIPYTDHKGNQKTIPRNGCYGCCTDIAFKDNHMAVLRQTHPHLWRAVMKYGMAQELQNLAIAKQAGTTTVAQIAPIDYILEHHECAFDDMRTLANLEFEDTTYEPED